MSWRSARNEFDQQPAFLEPPFRNPIDSDSAQDDVLTRGWMAEQHCQVRAGDGESTDDAVTAGEEVVEMNREIGERVPEYGNNDARAFRTVVVTVPEMPNVVRSDQFRNLSRVSPFQHVGREATHDEFGVRRIGLNSGSRWVRGCVRSIAGLFVAALERACRWFHPRTQLPLS